MARLRVQREIALESNHGDVVARQQLLRYEARARHGRVTDELGVVGNNSKVVQRMNVFDASGDFERSCESNTDVADRDGHRVAVDHDEAALRVGDEPGSIVMTIGHTRDRVRHVEVDEHE